MHITRKMRSSKDYLPVGKGRGHLDGYCMSCGQKFDLD